MKIYTPDNQLLLDIFVDDDSYRLREIMGANNLELRFTLPQYIPIVEGSYCDFQTERYWMPRALDYVKEHSEKFSYTLSLEGSVCFLKATKFKFFDYVFENGKVKPTSSFKLKFPITATPRMAVDLLVANLKLKYPQYPWAVGECIDSEPVVIDFNHDYCFDVLPKLADKFNTEWELDRYTFHIRKVEKMKDLAIDLSYGYNNGILGGIRRIQYDDKRIINRVYIEGGDRNIDRSKYGNDTLLLPKSKRIVYEGVEYTTDASGSFLERVNPLAGEEDSLDVSKFYPKRIGVVSVVEKINDKQGFYNIIDDSIPELLDYSKMIIAGETMTVIFQTGQLAGKEFDAKYNHSKRKFELVPIEENGLIYPQGNIIPAVGDTYAVFHMRMPDNYITDAENETLQETVKYLSENEQPQYSYRWQLDGIYAKRNWGSIRGYLDCGYYVRFSDPQFLPVPVNVRIVAVKEPVNDLQSPEITIANKVSSRSLGSVINEIPTITQTVDRKDKEVMRYAKRGWKDTQELIEAVKGMVDDFENASLSADVFEGMMALFGSASLQFQFLADDWITAINPFMSYNPQTKQFTCHAAKVQHMTMGIDSVQPERDVSRYKFWTVSGYISPVLTDANEPYFVYMQASKTFKNIGGRNVGEATFFISKDKIKIDDVPGYHTLWVGYLNSENMEGDRSFRTMYGYTEILPGQITVDKLMSTSGALVIDLLNGVITARNGATIQGNIKFLSSNGDYKNVGEVIDQTNDKIDNLQLGVDNLLYNSKSILADSSKPIRESVRSLYVKNGATYSIRIGDIVNKKGTPAIYEIHFYNPGSDEYIEKFQFTQANKIITFTANSDFYDDDCDIIFYAGRETDTGNIVEYCEVMVVEGNTLPASWTPSRLELENQIEQAKKDADQAKQEAENAQQNVTDLNDYVDGAFADGVIDTAEAKAIEKYLNTLDETMSQVEATYNKLYVNPYLEGQAKQTLLMTKINLFNWSAVLKTSINTAIADGKTTAAEKADVDSKFKEFNSRLKDFQSAVEDANRAIQSKLDSLTTDKINNIQLGVDNLIYNSKSILADSSKPRWEAARSLYVKNGTTYSIRIGDIVNKKGAPSVYEIQFYNPGNDELIEKFQFTQANKTITFTANSDHYDDDCDIIFYAGRETDTGNIVEYHEVMVVEGNTLPASWTPSRLELENQINGAKKDAAQAKQEADKAKQNVTDLNNYVDGAFSDGIVDAAEAKAIEKYFNTLDETMSQVEATYNKLYVNNYLEGVAKTNLLNAKINLFGARDSLKTSILTAIADGRTTPAEKANVDSKFATFNTYLKAFQNAVEDANKAIQNKLDTLSTEKINNIQVGVLNLLPESKSITAASIQNVRDVERKLYIKNGATYTIRIGNIVNKKGAPSVYEIEFYNYGQDEYADKFQLSQANKTITFTANNEYYNDYCELLFYAGRDTDNGYIVEYQEVMVVEGNKVNISSWMPSINEIEANTDKANKELANIADDNLLTPGEKQDVLKEWQIIQGEKPTYNQMANTYGLSTSTLDTTYNNLNAYITPLLANMNRNSTINGADFRSKFKAYYDAKISLLNQVTAKAKQIADTAQNVALRKVRYIRDWLNGSSANANNHWVQIKALDKAGTNIALNKTVTGVDQNPQYITNGNTTSSNFAESSIGLRYAQVDLGQVYDINAIQVWHYYTDGRTYKATKTEVSADGINWLTIFDSALESTYKETSTGRTYYVKDYQSVTALMKDLEYIKTAIENRTEIDGGLLLTVLLKLGLFSGNTFIEKAGINGAAKNANDVVAWFGGTLQQAIQNLAAIVFRMDGSGQLAKGNIKWDANGNPIVKGTIYAENGEFNGKVTSNKDGNRIVIDPVERAIIFTDSQKGIVGKFTFSEFGTVIQSFSGLSQSFQNGTGFFSTTENANKTIREDGWLASNALNIQKIEGGKVSKQFKVSTDSTSKYLKVNFKNLPKDSTGLEDGDLWLNNGKPDIFQVK